MKKQRYGMPVESLLMGIEVTRKDLDFLCSLVEAPDTEYPIPDAIDYSTAIVALNSQLRYMVDNISVKELTEDEELFKISQKELLKLTELSENVEKALERLRACGISLKSN